MTEQSETRQQQDQTYVVLIERTLADWEDRGGDAEPRPHIVQEYKAWVEIATVTVPPRTKRSVVIKKALAEAGIKPSDDVLKVRALDVDSFEVHEPKVRQVEPEWVL